MEIFERALTEKQTKPFIDLNDSVYAFACLSKVAREYTYEGVPYCSAILLRATSSAKRISCW